MKNRFSAFIAVYVMMACLYACETGGSHNENVQDTAQRTTTDTTMLPGSPGPSGTQPTAHDTTQAYRDSLKHVVRLPDSTGKYSGN